MGLKIWLGVLLLSLASSDIQEDSDDVWVLTDSNFELALSKQPEILVEFYAPWCGHCRKLAPEYSKAAKSLLKNSPPIRLAKVDVTENPKLAQNLKIEVFPTLKYFVNKVAYEYTGGQEEYSIVSWVLKRQNPSLSIINSLPDFQAFAASNKVVAVLFGQPDTPESAVFESLSKVVDSVAFALLTDPEAASSYSLSKNSLILLKHFEEKRVNYRGRITQSEVSKFINDNRLPQVLPFNEDAINAIFQKVTPGVLLLAGDYEPFQNWFQGISKDHKSSLVFTHADLAADGGKLSEFLGVKASQQPTLVIIEPSEEIKKYRYLGEVNEKGTRQFISDWRAKKIEPYLKSEDFPENELEGSVKVLVGKNFEQVVFDKSKNVLVEFYAPWCGHCKALAPEYQRLAAEFKRTNVVVAKMDATANEVRGVTVKSFPTLKFYPAGDKKVIEFEGIRNLDGMKKFILQKSTNFTEVEEDEKIEL